MPMRIMVFNDTQEILELFQMLLTDEGYEVALYSYSANEIHIIEAFKPDLLILDYTVGRERNGWQLLQKLKMVRSTASIPVIICTTAYRLAEEIEGYLLTKKVKIVRKPFDIEDLLLVIKETLEEAKKIGPKDASAKV